MSREKSNEPSTEEKRRLALERRRELRRCMTRAERLLWAALRARQLGGYKFRRQHPIGPFIVDFACESKRLVIEIDGGYHLDNYDNDVSRQAKLVRAGYRVLRFANAGIYNNLENVVEATFAANSASNASWQLLGDVHAHRVPSRHPVHDGRDARSAGGG